MRIAGGKKFRGVLLLWICLSLLCGCSSLHRLESTGEHLLTDSRTGITYRNIRYRYEPIAVGKAYAEGEQLTLHTVAGLDPAVCLTEPFDGTGSIWVESSWVLPETLTDFAPQRMAVCARVGTGSKTMQIHESTDADLLRKLGEALSLGEENPKLPSSVEIYTLKCTSPDWPGLYYALHCMISEDFHIYVYDRASRRMIEADELLGTLLRYELDDLRAAAESASQGESGEAA